MTALNTLKNFKKIGDKGMTFIELLVVTAIILIMAGALWIGDPRPGTSLEIAVRQVANDLRLVQNMAMAAETRTAGTEEYVPCSYGIRFSLASSSYSLLENYGGVPPNVTCPGSSFVIEVIDLPAGMEIGTSTDILFSAPYGGKSPAATTTIPVRRIDNPSNFRNIIINERGTIDIE